MAFIVQYITVNGENLVKKKRKESLNNSCLYQNFKNIKKVIFLAKFRKVFAKELSGLYRGRLSTCKFAK